MLLCYSFVQLVVRLFDDLNDYAEYHLSGTEHRHTAMDVDVRRRMSDAMCIAQ